MLISTITLFIPEGSNIASCISLNSTPCNIAFSEILRTFGGFSEPSLVKTLLAYLQHEDSAVVAWAIHSLVELGGDEAITGLQDFIDKNDGKGLRDLNITQAISSMAKLKK